MVVRQYEGWEDFQTHIKLATDAVEVKPPPYASRIGLRFRKIFRKSVVGLTGKIEINSYTTNGQETSPGLGWREP
ncbi:MAG: hypothetical protein NPIRA06_33880 [Nitrospirales bacterium]|nr:MAG: hypothetical protein NPIRA06_33880 [Nitrospirales bacterium]